MELNAFELSLRNHNGNWDYHILMGFSVNIFIGFDLILYLDRLKSSLVNSEMVFEAINNWGEMMDTFAIGVINGYLTWFRN